MSCGPGCEKGSSQAERHRAKNGGRSVSVVGDEK